MGVEEITQYPPHPNPLPQGGEEDGHGLLNIYKTKPQRYRMRKEGEWDADCRRNTQIKPILTFDF